MTEGIAEAVAEVPTLEEPITTLEPETEQLEPVIPVHPFAASFPMLDDEELDELVEDIRENGLRRRIVLDVTGQLIDGRNRLIACQRAGVKPEFETKTDLDPLAFILSENVMRRHLSKGQRAMAFAMAYPDATEKGGRGKTSVFNTGVSSEYVTKARFVLRHAPDLAAKVMSGSPLPEAYNHAADQKREREEYERLRSDVREHIDSILSVCVRVKSNIERSDTAFLDQTDFVRDVRVELKTISEAVERAGQTL